MPASLDLPQLVAGNLRAEIAKRRISEVPFAGFADVSTAQLYVLAGHKSASLDFVAKLATALEMGLGNFSDPGQ